MPPRLLHYSDLENAYDTPARVARVAACIRDLRDETTIVAGSGDDTGPGVLSLVSDGRQSLDFFERVEPAVETVGNHDFDHGPDSLLELISAAPQTWVVNNVEHDGHRFGTDTGVERLTAIPVGDSAVGVTGVLAEATPDMVPDLDSIAVSDPVATTREVISNHDGPPVDAMVVLAHVGTEIAEEIASLDGVDAVLAGHRHDPRTDHVSGTPFSRPGATGRFVVELDLDTGELVRHRVTDWDPDDAMIDALEERIEASGLDEVITTRSEPLHRSRSDRTGREWRLGNFVADAYRWKTGADVALQNTGGIRDGPPLDGTVTRGELIGVSPFEEPVVVAEVTGEELDAIATEADGRYVPEIPDRWWGHVSGMVIRANGDGYAAFVDGARTDPDARYTLAAPRYLLTTDREFPTLSADMAVESYDVQYEVIVEYAREEGLAAPLDGRLPDRRGHHADADADTDADFESI